VRSERAETEALPRAAADYREAWRPCALGEAADGRACGLDGRQRIVGNEPGSRNTALVFIVASPRRCGEYIRKSWSARIPKAYEELLDAAMRAGDHDGALRILMAMTAMVPSLTPARMREVDAGAVNPLRSSLDFSHVSTEDLYRLLGREPPSTSLSFQKYLDNLLT
jgi:hypothetical protein